MGLKMILFGCVRICMNKNYVLYFIYKIKIKYFKKIIVNEKIIKIFINIADFNLISNSVDLI